MQRLLLTGGAGKVAALLRPRLARPGRTVRLVDIVSTTAAVGEEFVAASVDDLDAMTAACAGVDAVVHLGGASKEGPVDEMLRRNTVGTWCVLEAARRSGVDRVVLASSNHVAGFVDVSRVPPGGIPADVPARPDTAYAVSKVAAEATGRLYADRYGMDVVCLRIGQWTGRPPGARGLAMWLSPDDGGRLVEAAIATHRPGFRVVWGISRNSRRWCSLDEGAAIGYLPQDDAESFVDGVDLEPQRWLGGAWTAIALGERR